MVRRYRSQGPGHQGVDGGGVRLGAGPRGPRRERGALQEAMDAGGQASDEDLGIGGVDARAELVAGAVGAAGQDGLTGLPLGRVVRDPLDPDLSQGAWAERIGVPRRARRADPLDVQLEIGRCRPHHSPLSSSSKG